MSIAKWTLKEFVQMVKRQPTPLERLINGWGLRPEKK